MIALTGTLIGGYAEHLRPLLFRLAPRTLVAEGFGWSDVLPFNEAYGRIEIRITEKSGGADNTQSRGSSVSKSKYVRPGIMPTLFGRHLIGNCVFLGLSEVAENLPNLEETVRPVPMDDAQRAAYKKMENSLKEAVKRMVCKGDKRLLGPMLNVLLGWVDSPYDWDPVGYYDGGPDGGKGAFVTVTMPPDLDGSVVRSKERSLLELVREERLYGRQTWVFVQMTNKHDVAGRLERLMRREGLRTRVLRSSVPLAKREAWIAKHAPGIDVMISHPKLVETGLDLFDKRRRHNFPTLVFYETGYNLFTLRQASRRAWRIGQREDCWVYYLYYEGTMQDRAMTLMGKKLAASEAIAGKFSSEGLASLVGDGDSVEMALARSLAEELDDLDASREWKKVGMVQLPTVGLKGLDLNLNRGDLASRLRGRLPKLSLNLGAA